jgi:transcriptional regulator with XRE-family HTH domain
VRLLEPYRVVRWVGGRVAEQRRAYGLTQELLAEKLDVSIKYLQRVEAGEENLTIASVVNIANALATEPSYCVASATDVGSSPPRQTAQEALIAMKVHYAPKSELRTATLSGGKPPVMSECSIFASATAW